MIIYFIILLNKCANYSNDKYIKTEGVLALKHLLGRMLGS